MKKFKNRILNTDTMMYEFPKGKNFEKHYKEGGAIPIPEEVALHSMMILDNQTCEYNTIFGIIEGTPVWKHLTYIWNYKDWFKTKILKLKTKQKTGAEIIADSIK